MGIKLRVILGMFQFVSLTRIPTQCAKTPLMRTSYMKHELVQLPFTEHNQCECRLKANLYAEPTRQGPQTTRKGRKRQRGKPKRKKHMGKKLRQRRVSQQPDRFRLTVKHTHPDIVEGKRFCSIIMTCRDRTLEFQSACKSLQGRQLQNGTHTKPAINALKQRSDFTLMAKRIGKDLSNTFAKLEKLTILAKRKSLFDDKAVEIEELTYIIKQDINSLNKQIAQLQDLVRSRSGQNGRHIQTHSNTIVVSLQSKLASMSNDFNSVLMQDESRSLGGEVAIDMDSRANPLQLQLIDEQDSYIQSRADTMQNIESTIVELGSIFQQLAHMVKEQEETIQRIDANVEDTQLNVEMAHTEILKYFQSVSSNRWLMIKIFLVLIIFFIIFVVFLA
ncbi:syntaxin-5 isoform X1 [Labeo rohita]|uniref:Syntaxin-5 isoform X1 n=1 Tax=Labeo rohita TaxID=84645 RepID=A0A498N9Z7_LABRO|nr:syntaxin-5 isoform X1 [Labeo rohita]